MTRTGSSSQEGAGGTTRYRTGKRWEFFFLHSAEAIRTQEQLQTLSSRLILSEGSFAPGPAKDPSQTGNRIRDQGPQATLFPNPVPAPCLRLPSSPTDGLRCPHRSLATTPSPPSRGAAENEREDNGEGLIPYWILPASCHTSPLAKPLWLHTKPLPIASPTCLAGPPSQAPAFPTHLKSPEGCCLLLLPRTLSVHSILGHPCACGVSHPFSLQFSVSLQCLVLFPTVLQVCQCLPTVAHTSSRVCMPVPQPSGLQAGPWAGPVDTRQLWASPLTLVPLKANLRHLTVFPSRFSPAAFGELLLRSLSPASSEPRAHF